MLCEATDFNLCESLLFSFFIPIMSDFFAVIYFVWMVYLFCKCIEVLLTFYIFVPYCTLDI